MLLLVLPIFCLGLFVSEAPAPTPPPCALSIGDFVWHDMNGNALQDSGEPGIPGVIVRLLDASMNIIATTSTDATGFYQFTGLCAGTYHVQVENPVGYAPIAPCSTDQAIPNDSNCSPATVELIADNHTIDFGFVVPATGCVRSPGYWKNHRSAWRVEEIVIGGITYPKADAIAVMETPVRGDKTYTLFKALVAARLNVLSGADFSCIGEVISAADAWMAEHPAGSSVAGSSEAWKFAEPLYLMLDAYNNGRLCVPHCD